MKAVFLLLLLHIGSAHAKSFQFLYLEASEGNASGGHVAVQLSNVIYHYQYENALIRLFKRDTQAFLADYQLRQNRSLHVADVAVSDATYMLISDFFKQRFFEQTQQLKQLQAVQHDQFLVQALLEKKVGTPIFSATAQAELPQLPGAGLFYTNTDSNEKCNTRQASITVLGKVKQQLENQYGKNFLSQKIIASSHSLRGLKPTMTSFSEHYNDLLNGLLALQVLQNSQALTKNSCFEVNSPSMRLSDADITQARSFQQRLIESAQSLTISNRPDWGYALFVTLARIIVLEQSIQTRQWTFLEDTDETVAAINSEQLMLYAAQQQKQRTMDLRYLHEAIADFKKSATPDEQDYTRLEMAANRHQQWLLSDKSGELRYASDQPLPHKSVPISHFLMTDLPAEQFAIALRQQKPITEHAINNDKQRNAYQLLTKNCVTMLLELINAAVSGKSEALLGGYIDPKTNFIPFQAFDAVLENYKVISNRVLPAYRQQKLTTLYAREVDSWVYARESNIFSSSLYNHNPDDAWFVFFTDDTLWFRPLFGAVNTLAATSQSLLGLLRLPFDDGKEVKIGVRGVLTSLPELAFFNIRKGSYPYRIEP
ncbi:hypothetical protein [Crenothrix sp.]|uniref:hypothetical protein n=1 Tax=Crenothrix sp. TaxID=3100433 RepID=UPI00374D417B